MVADLIVLLPEENCSDCFVLCVISLNGMSFEANAHVLLMILFFSHETINLQVLRDS